MIGYETENNNQLPVEIRPAFQELKVLKHLRNAGITKRFGVACSYLFQLVFVLIFHHRNWFQFLDSAKSESYPGKDAVYRFLNHAGFAWRRFLLLLSVEAVNKTSSLTSDKRVSVFVVDDSMYERNRSKCVELLARFKDHARNCYYKGFRMLTLGWSDGHTFVPVDFSLLSSVKSQIQGLGQSIDKRTHGYKRRMESLLPAPDIIPAMIDRALSAGMNASYVLMDSWFTHAPLIQAVLDRGLDVIGMVKADNKRYLLDGRCLSLQELYYAATPVQSTKKGILRSIHTQLRPGIPIKMVFVRHRTNKKEWLAILSTDTTLTVEKIVQIYGIRWDIEVFFKCTKSLLRLQKEFQGRSYDMLISHTTIVFSRYILLAWQHRQSTDNRTLGNLFLMLCDEVSELDWAIALSQLVELVNDVSKKAGKRLSKLIRSQLQRWIDGLPSYIKAYLPVLACES
ncbi:transposase (plasmid) [Alicyclobacillus fastidiosus]|uniref:Transposase n=1 Tax=Alicyclobacillus fastidiosus TaxID=392011 RepID=A0ABY6ZH05_9BACL|nr:transposase [Alicyclobacillus fastidiosus]WAH40712.1 transposase [Alicyclobacillus fastidiosus]WAH41782.1 transposase [Alicyclobacillus fastidiosus]WAH42676.1 transposase [Alicyclobacillus fastidiosus]WAH42990.1 transposase [Alicyclobacillus fastidiosus]WAH43067.1 transposase [Alicyclobacillus fastidiosus]